MRDRKRRLSTALARHVVNPMMRAALDRGIAPRGYALLETTGRTSGLPRRTPVGNGSDGDTFWVVAEHGRSAAYVRNIEADPRVRVKVGRKWRSGTASLLPDDDPRQRQRTLGRTFNAAVVRLMGTELLTVRVDLDAAAIGMGWELTTHPPASIPPSADGATPGGRTMSQQPSIRVPRGRRPGWLRTSVVGAVALVSLGLSGCGDPDDDTGGGGGGYLAEQQSGQVAVPRAR